MKEILAQFNELISICENRIKQLDQERAEIAIQRKNFVDSNEELEKRRLNLDKREEAISASEHAIVTAQAAAAMLNDAQQKIAIAGTETRKLIEAKEAFNKEKADFDAWRVGQKEKLAKMAEETEANKKKYKQEVLELIEKERKAKKTTEE